MISERLLHPAVARYRAEGMFAAILILVMVTTAAFGDEARWALRFDRPAIGQGEWFRLITGHLVHLGWTHLALNLAGLALLLFVDGRQVPLRWRMAETVLLCMGISVGLLLWVPELQWYVGFSGVLHGLFLLALMDRVVRGEMFPLLVLLLLIGKIALEHYDGAMPWSRATLEHPVIVEAHAFGVITAMLYWIASFSIAKLKSPS